MRSGCWLGPNVVLTNAMYPRSKNVENLIGPDVKNSAIIGANSTVLPGVVIGENSLVGAGSVIVKECRIRFCCCGVFRKKVNEKTFHIERKR